MISAIDNAIANYGSLVNNFNISKSVARAISAGDHSFNTVPALLEDIIENGRWLDRINPHSDQRITLKPHEFRKYLEAPAPEGLGTTDAHIRQYLKSPRLIDLYNKATVGERGSNGQSNNPSGKADPANHEPNPNAVRVRSSEPEPIVVSIPIRDRSGEPMAGNSRGYALRRLARDRPDLHSMVINGELTPNNAMVEAGFRRKLITIPPEPDHAARLLAKHFQADRLEALIAALESHRANTKGLE